MQNEWNLRDMSFFKAVGGCHKFVSLVTFTLLLGTIGLFLTGCGGRPTVTGYWEGEGKAVETPMKDDFRLLTRSADFQFWFTLDQNGNAVGEVEIVYDAELKVENLPQVTVPAPGGNMSFNPKVGGKLTDLDPSRRFPIVGVLAEEELTLEIAVAEDDREPLEFTLRADAGVSGGFGPVGVPLGEVGASVHKISMTPFSPFGSTALVEKRAGGPYAVHYEDKGENYAIEWSARQLSEEQGEFEMTPELQEALRRLRQRPSLE